ncbi:MAG TPA: tetratricopeptide repeat protein [Terriglobia bacterium]|nr:tetratricopeptide repeat protein [Terriglobia bacterium]
MLLFRWPVAALLLTALWCAPASGRGVDTLESRVQSALAHYNARQYAAAQRELEALERDVPRNFEVQELLGLVYSAQGQEAKATPRFEAAVRLQPDSGPARNNLATNLARLGKASSAEKEFKRVVELEPASYDANHNLGEFYVGKGDIAAAVPYLERAQQADPASYDNGYNLALAYETTGRLGDASRQIRELLKQKDTAELHDLLGEVEEKSGNYVSAVNEYQAAAHMDPSESNLFDWGGELLLHQTWGPAIQVFSAGLKRYPNSARLAVGLGLAHYVQGSYDDAVKALMTATDVNPADPQAYYFLSKAYDQSPNQADEVIERFRRFADLRPNDAQAEFYYAMSLWKGRRSDITPAHLDQVEALLKKCIALDPSSGEAHLQLANLYSQRKNYQEAEPEYQQAVKLSPDLPDAHYRLGQAYAHLGKQDLAQKEFQIHQTLYERHLAEIDQRRSEIKQFVYSMKGAPAGP